jgi:hypothetical protein
LLITGTALLIVWKHITVKGSDGSNTTNNVSIPVDKIEEEFNKISKEYGITIDKIYEIIKGWNHTNFSNTQDDEFTNRMESEFEINDDDFSSWLKFEIAMFIYFRGDVYLADIISNTPKITAARKLFQSTTVVYIRGYIIGANTEHFDSRTLKYAEALNALKGMNSMARSLNSLTKSSNIKMISKVRFN